MTNRTKELDSYHGKLALEGPYIHNLYIAYSIQNEAVVQKMRLGLAKIDKDIKFYSRHVKAYEEESGTVIGRIIDGVRTSKNCLIFWSKDYENDQWQEKEIVEIISKAERFDKASVTIVTDGTRLPQNIAESNFTQINWNEPNMSTDEWMKSLFESVTRVPSPNLQVLPRENMGHGSAMGYYYGFLYLVLPDFRERLVKQLFTKFPEMAGNTIKKMLIIIPTSCVCPPALVEPGKIEFSDRYITRLVTRAGNIARDYKSTVYKFIHKEPNRTRDYYFVGELATPLVTMYETFMFGLANMSRNQLYLQRDVFYFTLKNILEHPKNTVCTGQFKILWWCDDKKEDGTYKKSLYDFLLPHLQDELTAELEEEAARQKGIPSSSSGGSGVLESDNIPLNTDNTAMSIHLNVMEANPYAYYESLGLAKYELNTDPKGLCVIINIENFTSKSDTAQQNVLNQRRGATQDLGCVRDLFHWLKFEVEIYQDVDVGAFETALCITSSKDHSAYSAFVCVIMTHGKLGSVFSSDGVEIRVLDIVSFFSDRNCRSLRGKPKMFFIQACQKGTEAGSAGTGLTNDGAQQEMMLENEMDCMSLEKVSMVPEEKGSIMTESSAEQLTHSDKYLRHDADADIGEDTVATGSQLSLNRAPTLRAAVNSLTENERSFLVPGEPDFLMSYSTLPGSISYRDTQTGSLYIKALDNNLRKPLEIDRALKAVTEEVQVNLAKRRKEDRFEYTAQLPFHLTTGMSKLLYLSQSTE